MHTKSYSYVQSPIIQGCISYVVMGNAVSAISTYHLTEEYGLKTGCNHLITIAKNGF